MAKKKAARDKIMAGKEGEKGLIIVHTGAGKGKSRPRAFGHDPALHRARDALRRGAVHQGRLGYRRARC
jgi:ATP:corrinoid adenosyltransferase